MVVVNQDGSWNFTNITAAVAVAPTYSNGSNGYFVIYVVAGVYQEYVTITKHQTYLMMIGDGIKQTTITGNHSDGSGNFTNITAAVAAAPTYSNGSNGYFVIYVVAGVYQEYVTITKNQTYLMMIGDGINHTIITGNHSVADGWTTFNSATFVVEGQGFVALNLTIRNTAGPQKFQAVALRNDADLSTFYNCSFEGYQDTLYTHSLRQFYRQCDVYGTVDFIFGNAATVLQDCNLYPRLPLLGQSNTITAQGKTDINQNTGTSIHNCSITAAQDLASSNGTTQTFLGRPWKLYSSVVYMQSFMDYLINPAGWAPWSGDFALNTSYYAEYNNYGPGSNTSNRAATLDQEDMVIDESNSGEPWVQGLMEGEYSDLSVEEPLSAVVALIGVANEGNSIRIILEECLEAANALKKQMWAEVQLDKCRMKEEYVMKIQYPSCISDKTEPNVQISSVEGRQSPLPTVDDKNNLVSTNPVEQKEHLHDAQNDPNYPIHMPSKRNPQIQELWKAKDLWP
ncbi:hypothetical protein HYC85_016168 [Camellia sinensis]|uniref:Pectinesterase n=1 Tax=Camellia sinensis TaxID=4442 RepID=A0A7J7GZ33_CAMSI|nr:hypothetical protein HYC85_016168 [Camellia sinensis]